MAYLDGITLEHTIGIYEETLKIAHSPVDSLTLEFLKELKAYRDAEEQGLLLRPKVALNSLVYMESEYWGIIPYKVCDISYGMFGFVYTVCAFRFDELLDDNEVVDDDFGKIVFATKEEAEQKLAEMKGENNG